MKGKKISLHLRKSIDKYKEKKREQIHEKERVIEILLRIKKIVIHVPEPLAYLSDFFPGLYIITSKQKNTNNNISVICQSFKKEYENQQVYFFSL